jgi:MFS family permease
MNEALPRQFYRFLIARGASAIALQTAAVAFGWHMYDLTGSPMDLGLVGLVQFLPAVALVFVVGHVADRFRRNRVVGSAQLFMALFLLLLTFGSHLGRADREAILIVLFLTGVARSFEFATSQAIPPLLVDNSQLPRALALGGSVRQACIIAGPLLGGFLYLAGPATVYGVSALLYLCSAGIVLSLRIARPTAHPEPVSLSSLFAGVTFIRSRPVVLGAISLDLFAVLLGGATALLPIFARDILHAGPWGLGFLRAAPAVGALAASLWLARNPLHRRVGRTMFGAVACFGLATIIFALSHSLTISILALAILGGADMISVVIRATLVQLETPDEMRGRVSAINAIFIGTSNEFGEFESGLTAAWFGAVPAACIGGIGTLAVVLIWMRLFPDLLRRERLRSG